MKIEQKELKLDGDNDAGICQIILENDNKIRVKLLTLGATIQSIELPFPDGTRKNVVLTYADWKEYIDNPLYLGTTLAPNAGRISNAEMKIGGELFELSQNEGKHNSHGGFQNASRQNWRVGERKQNETECSVSFTLHLPDGLDGFPGERELTATYTLTNENALQLHYYATSSCATYLNLSNHSYFNMSGDLRHSGLEQIVQMNANQYVKNNKEHIPMSLELCQNSHFDFNCPKSFRENMKQYEKDEQLAIARGYNNAFIILESKDKLRHVLDITDSSSQCTMRLYSDAPALVVYSGGYIGNEYLLDENRESYPSCGIALELQDIPDIMHFDERQCTYTTPEHPFYRNIKYQFIIK